MAIKNDDTLSEFGQKIMMLMVEIECDTPKALAIKLLEKKLVTVNTRGKDIYKNKDNAVGSVEKKIRVHLHSDDATCLQGEFVNAYCKIFDCSADYILGYTNIRNTNMDIRKICETTGLSEQAVIRMVDDNAQNSTRHYVQGWSQILESVLYKGIIDNWQMAGEQAMLAAQKDIERKQLNEKIRHASGPDVLDIRADMEGTENAYKSANAAYSGLLFNISRNMAGFIEYSLQSSIKEFVNRFAKT